MKTRCLPCKYAITRTTEDKKTKQSKKKWWEDQTHGQEDRKRGIPSVSTQCVDLWMNGLRFIGHWEYNKITRFYQLSWSWRMATVKSFWRWRFERLPFERVDGGIASWVFKCRKWSYAIEGNIVMRKKIIQFNFNSILFVSNTILSQS